MPQNTTQHPVPDNEQQRLTAVRSCEIFDTAPEAEFDAIARVAARLFDTPIAYVAMMDSDRLWFKAKVGLEVQQLDRAVAVCSYTVMQTEPLVIEDLRRDRRFEGNLLVAHEPYLRFYAGAPIVDTAGNVLGTVAVMDRRPRNLTEAQRSALRELPVLAMTALDARRLAIQLSRLAMIEPSTGVFNRIQFDLALETELNHSMRTGEPFTVLRLGLDGLKDVSDGFGLAAKEAALVEISRRLSQQVRIGDVLARLGDADFGVVMRHGGEASAEVLVGRITRAVGEPITLPAGDVVGVGVSIGIAAYTDDVGSAAELLGAADKVLAEAKEANQRRWSVLGRSFNAAG